ncbi:hypothetical protein V2W30_05730 [Streptomyces sp. Q6]|uniref:Uncharacterized protein n=1 Tax=Streptomyces citrinus TaxID=3118173 RepID=A0ACD5APR9_9ACTN
MNQATVPATSGVCAYPDAVSVWTAPRPPVTTYPSLHVRCRCGVPPHSPSAAGQSYTDRCETATPPGRPVKEGGLTTRAPRGT